MSILLIEMEVRGHHISSYTRSIVANLIKKKKKIILLTSGEIKNNKFYLYLKKNTKIICVKKIKYPDNKKQINFFKFQLDYYSMIKKTFEKIYKKNKIDYVYLNTLDFLDKPLSIFGSPFGDVNFSGLYLNPKFYMSFNIFSLNYIKKIIYEILFFRLLRINNLKNIFFVDPLCFNYLKKKNILYPKKISLVNEMGTANQIKKFTFSKRKCKKILKIENNKFIILVYGSIRENKSLSELVKIASRLTQEFQIKILIAGEQDSETRNFLKKNVLNNKLINNSFIILNQYIDDRLEKIIFKAADVTWLGYSKNFYGSSGVLFLSSQNKVPVIGSDHGVLNWYLKKFNIGFAANLSNSLGVINIIEKLIVNKNRAKFDFTKINKNRNFLNFGKKIIEKIF